MQDLVSELGDLLSEGVVGRISAFADVASTDEPKAGSEDPTTFLGRSVRFEVGREDLFTWRDGGRGVDDLLSELFAPRMMDVRFRRL
jgi:hypothetical protein